MRLDQVIPSASAGELQITDLAYDNRQVHAGTLFFCVTGFTRDGHDFAPDAVARGSVALVVERRLNLGVPEIVVPSVREAIAPLAAAFYRDPTAKLQTVGVTGTNGKPRPPSSSVRSSRRTTARPGSSAR
jgi:UDP-N-acetylmuramoyl-L-alanyl-D-glutamate--2,6-diaminopimelate ligase